MKKKLSLAVMILTIGAAGTVCFADEIEPVVAVQEQVGETAETRAADYIEIIYRNNNGHLEYRRWNATKGYWVDPYWIRVAG